MKNIANNTMYTNQEMHIFYNHLELNYKSFYLDVISSHQYFNYIFSINLSSNLFLHVQFL